MILQWFAEMFYKLFTALLSWINLPSIADNLDDVQELFDMIVSNGAAIYRFFVPGSVISVGCVLFLSITGFKYGYYLVLWILKKIPAVGIN